MEQKMTGYPSIDKPWLKYYTEEAVSTPLPQCTMYRYLCDSCEGHHDDTALIYFGRKISFGQLLEGVDAAARAYVGAGVKAGDVVTLCTITTPETVYSLYALNKIGAVVNMVDPRASADGLVDYLEEVHSKILLTINVALPKIEKLLNRTNVKMVINVSPADSMSLVGKLVYRIVTKKIPELPSDSRYVNWPDFFNHSRVTENIAETAYQEKAPAVIIHTGGTTGHPKGVVLSNDNFNSAVAQIKLSPLLMSPQDRFLNIMPPFIAYGLVLGVHTALSHRWQSILIPSFDPAKFSDLLLKHRPAGIMGVPTYFENLFECAKLKDKDLSFLRVALVGGDKVAVEFEERINQFFADHNSHIHISKGYSMTEASSTATFSFENCNKLGSAGIPFAKMKIAAFEPGTDTELKYNCEGELCINSPTMMLEYLGNPEETAEILRTHSDGEKWIHTGDLGYVDEDGCVYVCGRLKRMIIRYDGFKVFPPHIENVLSSHKAVSDCCVVGTPDTEHTQGFLPRAFVVLNEEYTGKEDSIKAELETLCVNQLAEYTLPADYRFIDAMPLTPIGKIDFRALAQIK